MKNTLIVLFALVLGGCGISDARVQEAVKKNPKIVFQTIEEHPTEFVESVNRAVKVAQEKQYERQIAEVNSKREQDLKNPKKPELDPKRRLSGSPTGQIVIVEYADFECPFCGVAYEGLKKFKEIHKDDVQFYYKNMPLDMHRMAAPSAAVYEAIFMQDPAKARKFYDYAFANQKQIGDEGFLRKAIMISGADPKRVEKDKGSEIVKKRIAADIAEFNKFKFSGTPVLILNGVALEGAQRAEDLENTLALTEMKR